MYTHVLCVCECPTDLQIVKHNIIGVTARLWNTNNFFIVAHFMLVVFHVQISESYKRDEDTQVITTLQEQRLRTSDMNQDRSGLFVSQQSGVVK